LENQEKVPVGGVVFADAPVSFNEGRPVVKIKVRNTGDRPIQVGSHFHFFEVNRALEFDRAAAYGMRLNIASTTAVRFEPGDEKAVELVPFGGLRSVYGFNDLVDSWTGDAHSRAINIAKADALGFKNVRH
jgi:urease subunit beta